MEDEFFNPGLAVIFGVPLSILDLQTAATGDPPQGWSLCTLNNLQ